MSSVIVEVVEVEDVFPHTNADKLCLATIKGWQTVIRKLEDGSPQFAPGDRVVYIPPDSTLPREMAEKLGIVTYLSEKTNISGDRELVVKQVRLRGEPSYGFIVAPEDPGWEVGTDVREHYGIGKFMPPVRFDAGDAEPTHPRFQRYTDIENLRNFPDTFVEGEEVVVSEKIHGTNARIGYIEGKLLAGSHGLQRKRPEPEKLATNTYWFPATLSPVMSLLEELNQRHRQVILYGEIYGSRVQKLHYGQRAGLGFAAFDLYVDDHYVDYDEFKALCDQHGVATVPILGRGEYSLDFVKSLSQGKTTLPDKHIREGVVVKPVTERLNPKIGRLVLKYLNDDYLLNDKLTAADATDM
ncbi:MAG: RNA ligase (ATP) [bacterium]|nr:RNA ligase (ATP) [bacterium]